MLGESRQEGDIVGDYCLQRLSSEGRLTLTWEAEQVSMQRPVMLEMLKSLATHDAGIVAAFLSDVKAKALVSHPGIGAVYEAVSNDDATMFARERIEGQSLDALHEAGAKFSPLEIVKLLAQISHSMLHLEAEGVATVEYDLHHFIMGSGQELRLMNLAVDGTRDEGIETRAKQLLGEFFDDALTPAVPGATRVGSLCEFMADLDRPIPLTWGQIADLSEQVREQLEGGGPAASSAIPEAPHSPPRQSFKVPPAFWALLGGLGLIAALIAAVALSGGDKNPAPKVTRAQPLPQVEIPAGEYALEGGQSVTIRDAFALKRTEVTLAQYHTFLESPDPAQFAHPEQPIDKKDHRPDSWKELWPAAVKGLQWEGRAMSTDCPVVGVDWWDAYAYAQWSQGRLPSLAEWAVAASFQGAPSSAKGWSQVDLAEDDETGAGLIGMAGSVREWTRDLEVNPAFELSPKKPVAAGGSFLKAENGIRDRAWCHDRSERRPDLGIRVVPLK